MTDIFGKELTTEGWYWIRGKKSKKVMAIGRFTKSKKKGFCLWTHGVGHRRNKLKKFEYVKIECNPDQLFIDYSGF